MEKVTASSGNIFEDMGLAHPEESLAKADIAINIEETISLRNLTQSDAARRMGITQPEVSNIVRGRLKGFTLDRLCACLNALDHDVEIVIKPAISSTGRTYVRPTRATTTG